MAIVINGREISKQILNAIKVEIQEKRLPITLGIIQASNDEATEIYVRNKIKRATECGINTVLKKFDPTTASQKDIENAVLDFNQNPEITGFFVQTPLPKQIAFLELTKLIEPSKDVDGLSPTNLGLLMQKIPSTLVSATASAVIEALKAVPSFLLDGKHAVIVGRSLIVGKPLSMLLVNHNCTVTLCHSHTKNLSEIAKTADVLVTATGKEDLITQDFIREGTVVIDCGSPKPEVNFEKASQIANYITPVPGGIGPITIACLLRNCLYASQKRGGQV